MPGDMLILQRGYAGELLNAFTTRGRRTPEPGGLRSATYLKYLRTPGSFSLQFNAHDQRVLSLRPYHLVEFWLRDGYNDLAYQQFLASLPAYAKDARMPGWYRDFTGLVLTEPRLEQEADGSYSSWIYGRGLNDWLYSEYIDYPPGQPQTRKNAPAETVAKELVNENIGPGAGVDAGGYTRVRAGLTIEPDGGAGATWKADRSRKLLGDVLQEVGDAGPGDYMIVQIGDAAFEFQWRSPHWGQDKRVGNGARRPMLFAARLGNVATVRSEYSYLDALSAVTVYGQGTSADLLPGTAYDTTLTAITSWARRAALRFSRSSDDADDITNYAQAVLRENQPRVNVDVETVEIVSSRYNVHWQVGDLVTVEDTLYGRQIDRKVLGVTVTFQAATATAFGLRATPHLGDFIDV